jgi:hypothetical protein
VKTIASSCKAEKPEEQMTPMIYEWKGHLVSSKKIDVGHIIMMKETISYDQ